MDARKEEVLLSQFGTFLLPFLSLFRLTIRRISFTGSTKSKGRAGMDDDYKSSLLLLLLVSGSTPSGKTVYCTSPPVEL